MDGAVKNCNRDDKNSKKQVEYDKRDQQSYYEHSHLDKPNRSAPSGYRIIASKSTSAIAEPITVGLL